MKLAGVIFNNLTFSGNNNKNEKIHQTNPLKQDTFSKGGSYDGLFGMMSDIFNFFDNLKNRHTVNEYLENMLDGQKMTGGHIRYLPFQDYNAKYYSFYRLKNSQKKYMDNLFEKAGISNMMSMTRFIKEYEKAAKACSEIKSCGEETLLIYGELSTKTDLCSYPRILIAAQKEKEFSDTEINLNDLTSFLKKLGIKNEKAFFTNFEHLKERFNDFESKKDCFDALDYVYQTSEDKLQKIKSVLQAHPSLKGEKAEKIYLKEAEIIDYLYEKDPDSFEKRLEKIIEPLTKLNKLSIKAREQLKGYDFNSPKGRIEFCRFLQEEDITPSEADSFAKQGNLYGVEVEDFLLNRNLITKTISDITGMEEKRARIFYSDFKGVLNAALQNDDATYSREGISAAISVIENFNIKNDTSFASFYNSITEGSSSKASSNSKTKKHELTGDEIREFIETISFADKPHVEAYKKNKNFPLLKEAMEVEERFLEIKSEIENLIQNSEFFLSGLSPFEVFRECSKASKMSSKDLSTTIKDMLEFRAKSSKDYEEKLEKFGEIKKYFKDEETARLFVSKNGIKWDDKGEGANHRNNCLKVLGTLQSLDKDTSFEYTRKLAESDFLLKSKSTLSSFIKTFEKNVNLRFLFETILDKNIESASDIKRLLKKYANDDNEVENVLAHFKNSPLSLEEYETALLNIQSNFDSHGIPVKINNDNINAIDMEKFAPNKKITQSSFINLAARMLNLSEDENFVYGLEKTFKDSRKFSSPYRIAYEIANNVGKKSDESYENILRELKLRKEDLGLPENVCKDDYVEAIRDSLPLEFVDFINDTSWLNFNNDKNMLPNAGLHAKLRMIDRFVLSEEGSIKNLNSDSTKQKLRDIFNILYKSTPYKIRKGATSHTNDRFSAYYRYQDKEEIRAVFLDNGELVTVIKMTE